MPPAITCSVSHMRLPCASLSVTAGDCGPLRRPHTGQSPARPKRVGQSRDQVHGEKARVGRQMTEGVREWVRVGEREVGE